MRVILDIDDKYATVLTFTAVGVHSDSRLVSLSVDTNVTTVALDLEKNTYARIDEDGKLYHTLEEVTDE